MRDYTKRTKTRQFKIDSMTEEGIITGHLSIFNIRDRGMEAVRPGAFRKSLNEHSSFPFLWQHDTSKVIGQFRGEETSKGLHAVIELNLMEGRNGELLVRQAGEAYANYKKGDIDSFSFGYYVVKSNPTKAGLDLLELELLEGSAATIPMHPQAVVESVKSSREKQIKDMVRVYRSLTGGMSRKSTHADEPDIIEALYYAGKKLGMIK